MKILFVSSYLPHAKAGHGTAVLLFDLVKGLTVSHEVSCLTFVNEEETALLPTVNLPIEVVPVKRTRNVQKGAMNNLRLAILRLLQFAASFFYWEPFYVTKYRHRGMSSALQKLTAEKKFDIVVIELSQMGHYTADVRSGKTLWHEIDVSFRPAYRKFKGATSIVRKAVAYIEMCRWAAFESRTAKKFDRLMPLTPDDQQLITFLSGVTRTDYLPCSVEVPAVFPPYGARRENTILFVGSFYHGPNLDGALWLAKEIFPLVRQEIPDAKLIIAGAHPSDQLKKTAVTNAGISVLGFVDDVDELFSSAAVFAAPLRYGGGVKVKIVTALAKGIPVVTTKVGVEGIETRNGVHVLLSGTPDRLAANIVALLKDRARAEAIGRAGWELSTSLYSTEAVVGRFINICHNALQT